jgi:LysM repeat protein
MALNSLPQLTSVALGPQHRRRRLVLLALCLALGPSIPPSASACDDVSTYVVSRGDTLTGIAAAVGVDTARLIALNALTEPDVIFAGQVLKLPQGREPISFYCIRPGDTLTGIAARTGMPADALADLNGIGVPDRILAGQHLRLSERAASLGPPATLPVRATPTAMPTSTATVVVLPRPSVTLTPTRSATPRSEQGVRWVGSPNFWPEWPDGPPIALVVHTAGGTLEGMDRWFTSPESGVSAHFGIGLDGRIHQYVALGSRAWTNGAVEEGHAWPGPDAINPNHLTMTIEMEDLNHDTYRVSDPQFRAAVLVGRSVLALYPQIRYLVTHRAIAPLSRANDPGPAWVESGRFAELARALGLMPVR